MSFAMNSSFYFLLLSEAPGKVVDRHPVLENLVRLRRALSKFAGVRGKGDRAVSAIVQRAAVDVLEHSSDDGNSSSDTETSPAPRQHVTDPKKASTVLVTAPMRASTVKLAVAPDRQRLKEQALFETRMTGVKERTVLGSHSSARFVGDDDVDEKVSGNMMKLQAVYNTLVQKQRSSKKPRTGGDEELPPAAVREKPKTAGVVGSAEAGSEHFGGGAISEPEESIPGSSGDETEFDDFYKDVRRANQARAQIRKER